MVLTYHHAVLLYQHVALAYQHVVWHPLDVCDWGFVAMLYAGHGTVADDGCLQGIRVFKARLKTKKKIIKKGKKKKQMGWSGLFS